MPNQATVSFEFFPPKTPEAIAKFWPMVEELARLKPAFMTVTYGAGGSEQNWTLETAIGIQDRTGIPTAAHLTCIGKSKADIDLIAQILWDHKISHIVALRGDKPAISTPANDNIPTQYQYASDLVRGLTLKNAFQISVAAYPEKHPEAPDLQTDIIHLRDKFNAGATRGITQLFYDNDIFYRFLDEARAAGITAPIVPGLLPVQSHQQLMNVTKRCQASTPQWLQDGFLALANQPEAARQYGIDTMTKQIQDLQNHGVHDFHFYTMNKSDLVKSVCIATNLTP